MCSVEMEMIDVYYVGVKVVLENRGGFVKNVVEL